MKKIFQILYLFLLTAPVHAQQVNPLDSLTDVGNEVYGTNQPRDLRIIIGNIVQVLLGFVGIVFVVLIIMGGIQWMTSGGNEQKISDAKKRIVNAAVGLTIIFIAYSVAYSITRWLVVATDTGGGTPTAPGPS